MDEQVQVVWVTAPDEGVGRSLARDLVSQRLAACVNLVPGIRSIYRWEGEVQEDTEVLLVIKTRRDRCEALTARVSELHPYDTPEVLVLSTEGGSAAYLRWVAEAATG